MDNNSLEGILLLHSETGTEGGYWAFQDSFFITRELPPFGVFVDQIVWDLHNPERKGKIQDRGEVYLNNEWLPLPDPMTEDPDYVVSSLFRGEKRGNPEADKRLMERYGFKIKYAADRMNERHGEGKWYLEDPSTAVTSDGTRWHYGGTPSTEPNRPYGVPQNGLARVTVKWDDGIVELKRFSNNLLVNSWSYEGLHLLGDGDHLTIYDSDNKDEVWSGVINLKHHPLFTEDAFGLWIHADQIGIDRETWAEYFFEGYPATLIPSKKTEE
ncbi:hypothetical protein GOV03_03045 [Candidatus Woesearchaeota archaeon]|nr:hypothetical protein [Candidatus Woesearchaeota archaeon]